MNRRDALREAGQKGFRRREDAMARQEMLRLKAIVRKRGMMLAGRLAALRAKVIRVYLASIPRACPN
jgi:hypothetical protein